MPSSLTIIGPPAAGKSSLTKELRRRVPAFTSFSVRSYFGAALRDGSPVGLAAAPYISANAWIPDQIVAQGIDEAFATCRITTSVIFEGMPGNKTQARLLDDLVARRGLPLPVPVEMDIDLATCLRRSRQRRVCMACDDGSWPADEDVNQPGNCWTCGGVITPRPADESAIFQRRLETYESVSPPLLSYYAPARLLRLDATQTTPALADIVLAHVSESAGTVW